MKILRARSSFIVLQVLDFVTTLIAFHFGAFEGNPLVARFATYMGPAWGVVTIKVIAVLIALRMRRLLWVVNLFYSAVVCWNVLIVFALSYGHH